MSDNTIIKGQCLCGAVEFEITPPTKGSAHCHCDYCRRAHGAPLVTWLTLMTDQFRFTAGEETVTWYQSSRQSKRGFCRICGSTMFFRSTQAPGETHVAMANLTDKADREPLFHCFSEQNISWFPINDELTQLRGDGPELSGYKDIKPHHIK